MTRRHDAGSRRNHTRTPPPWSHIIDSPTTATQNLRPIASAAVRSIILISIALILIVVVLPAALVAAGS
jgi:hypothetical protein